MMSKHDSTDRVLQQMLSYFYRQTDEVAMLALLKCLSVSGVVPVMRNGEPLVEEWDGKRWLEVCSDEEQLREDCEAMPMRSFADMMAEAERDDAVDGIVIDCDTHPFRIGKQFFELVSRV